MQDHEQAVEEAPRATPAAPQGGPATAQPLVERLLALQSLAGNRATAAYVRRTAGLTRQRGQGQRLARFVTDVGDEQLEVVEKTKDARVAEAKRIIDRLSTEYGISVNSRRALEGVRAGYPHVEESVRNQMGTRRWSFFELKAVEKAADHFRPLLGKLRAGSPRAGIAQEVTTVGKLDVAAGGSTVAGEYAPASGAVALYQHGERVKGEFGLDYGRNAELTATHEFAHGLARHALNRFGACMQPPYWLDAFTKRGDPNAEAPPTDYGATDIEEDLCESVAMYFVAPDQLWNGNRLFKNAKHGEPGNACPQRFAFVDALVKGWTPPSQGTRAPAYAPPPPTGPPPPAYAPPPPTGPPPPAYVPPPAPHT